MKTYLIPAVLVLFFLAGCSSTKKASDYDDVYYSAKAEKKQKQAKEVQTSDPDYYIQNENTSSDYKMEDFDAGEYVSYEDEPIYSETETIENPDGNTYITNNYYGTGGYGDYYDYSYSARINRFYNPYGGFNYYSPWYVGFYYDPWYNPYWYSPSFSYGLSWGWGGFGWGYGYPYYGNPYYGYPYNNYWYGYNNGYWDGYYASNYYDNSYYYGPRTSGGSTNSPSRASGSDGYYAKESTATYSDRNRPLLSSGVVSRPSTSTTGAGARNENANVVSNSRSGQGSKQVAEQSVTTDAVRNETTKPTRNAADASIASPTSVVRGQERNTGATPSAQETKPRYNYKKPTSTQSDVKSRYQPGEVINSRTSSRPEQKYSKPGSYKTDRNVSRSSSSGSQRSTLDSKPKSGSNESYSRPTQSNTSTRVAVPSRSSTKSYSQPSRSNTDSYSQPSKSSSNYSRPTNVGNTRSSYSRPSSSGSGASSGTRSYSAPSRSSSSGSGGTSSGSGGTRGRR